MTVTRDTGFFLQGSAATGTVAISSGVFVFTNREPGVEPGDRVRVSGLVAEHRPGAERENLTVTQIVTPRIETLARGVATPTAVVIGAHGRPIPSRHVDDDATGDVEASGVFEPTDDAIDFFESLEGMLVWVEDPIVVGPRTRFGEVVVLADGGAGSGERTPRGGILGTRADANPERITLDDEVLRDTRRSMPSANVGDALTSVVGVLDYAFNSYRVQVVDPPRVTSLGLARPSLPPPRDGEIAVATLNVENLHPGASAEKLNGLADVIVKHLAAPDLVALEEVQDNSGPRNDDEVDASQTARILIGAIVRRGGPAYRYHDIVPEDGKDGGQRGGNIRTGFLYRVDRGLNLVQRGAGDAWSPTRFVGGAEGLRLSLSPGRVAPMDRAFANSRKPLAAEFTFRDRTVFVFACHFTAKLEDQPDFGRFQPPKRGSDERRVAQARLVGADASNALRLSSDANVIVMGDLNDDLESPAMAELTRVGLVPLMGALAPNERYSYVFRGNSVALDHILVSPALVPRSRYFSVHVNAEFADGTSDHDPQVARIELG